MCPYIFWYSFPEPLFQICYFFYKNITFGLTLFYYEAFTVFSGQTPYNDWYLSLFNVFFTSLPVIALGVFEQDVSSRVCLQVLYLTLMLSFSQPWWIFHPAILKLSLAIECLVKIHQSIPQPEGQHQRAKSYRILAKSIFQFHLHKLDTVS